MAITVRAAAEQDIDVILQIHDTVQRIMATLQPKEVKNAVDPAAGRSFYAARLSSPLSHLAVAESDGNAVGYVWFEVRTLSESPFLHRRSRMFVQNMAVITAAQRRGVGSALMRYVEQHAIVAGIDEIEVGHWAANLEAQKFYESQGFSPFMAVLRKNVESHKAD